MAIEREVDVVLLTGDLVERDNRFYEAAAPLHAGLLRLEEAGIEVFMVAGNHDFDVLPQLVRSGGYRRVHLLGAGGRWEARYAEKGQERFRLLGWSFPEQYVYDDPVDRLPAGMLSEEEPAVVLMHGDIYRRKSEYAPLDPLQMRNSPGVLAWVLGHIHKADSLYDANPLIFYPGSPHAFSAKDTGPRGVYLLTVDRAGVAAEFVPTSPVVYEKLEVNVSEAADRLSLRQNVLGALRDLRERTWQGVQPARYLVVDVVLAGEYGNLRELEGWMEEIRDYGEEGERAVVVRTVTSQVYPRMDLEALASDPSYLGVLAQTILALDRGETTPFIGEMTEQWKKQYIQLAAASVYVVLNKKGLSSEEVELLARADVRRECLRLISVLSNQRSHED